MSQRLLSALVVMLGLVLVATSLKFEATKPLEEAQR